MPRVARFGPGRLESLRLELRSRDREGRLSGIFAVYCGYGWEHNVEVHTGWQPVSSVLNDEAIADRLLANWLDDWLDPCNEEEERDGDDPADPDNTAGSMEYA